MIITMRSLGALRTYPMQLGFWVIVALGMLALAFTLSGIYLACVCAASIPALRAARIDPIAALRHE